MSKRGKGESDSKNGSESDRENDGRNQQQENAAVTLSVMRAMWVLVIAVVATTPMRAQWMLQESHTTASLRGVQALSAEVAWASGTDGTVLRTVDGGKNWEPCAVPRGAEKLDFRGVQAVDARTAWVMSSGPGDASRLYQTKDACRTWALVFSNPDKAGFWDGLLYSAKLKTLFILGDPVDGAYRLFFARVGGSGYETGAFSHDWNEHPIAAIEGQAAFAASNTLLVEGVGDGAFSLLTGGMKSEVVHEERSRVQPLDMAEKEGAFSEWSRTPLPFAAGQASGAFSMALGSGGHVVVVGGDYQKPGERASTAAWSDNGGYKFAPAVTMPGGYRSGVAYDPAAKVWVAVGTSGTDVSADDGRNWVAVTGDNGGWNAVSLPFAVGVKGRIGVWATGAAK